jgi:molecular chaperone DnaK
MNNKEILVGIDFGTTNTVITHFINNKAEVISDGVFKMIPSRIGFYNEKIYCGNYIPINCLNIIHSFKLGPENLNLTQSEIYVIFFKHLYDIINRNLNIGPNGVIKSVITVPSNFSDSQRERIRGSFISVGFNVIRIINEPSAAALAYGLVHSSNSDEKILVIDTGGGTMDFTVLEKSESLFEVIHSEGLNDLGGNNFTNLVQNDIIRSLNLKNYNPIILWNQSQKIKEKLTYLDIWETKLTFGEKTFDYILTKTHFENMADNLLKKVELTLTHIIESYPEINYIIMVGGTSRIKILQEKIKEITKKNPWIHPNLESVVAQGAGLYAGIIENKYQTNDDVVLLDVLPLSLGVELADGSYSIIIPKNTPLPVKRTQKYTTDSPSDSAVKVKIYQGERKIANKNILIGEFVFDKVSMGGVPIIEISFKVDLNSIINITAIDRKSGRETNIILKDIKQMEPEEVNKICEQSSGLADMDESELLRAQHIYMIRTHIENALANLEIMDRLESEDKNQMINKFKTIEEKIEIMNNLELIECLGYLKEQFGLLGKELETEASDDSLDQVEKLFLNDRKIQLKNRIEILLAKNPEWDEYLNPVLEELNYSNISIDYINEKLKLVEELESDNSEKENHDYRQEVNNLCLYLKSELEAGTINLGENNELLADLLNQTINLIQENDPEINWKDQMDLLNTKCEELYNKKK